MVGPKCVWIARAVAVEVVNYSIVVRSASVFTLCDPTLKCKTVFLQCAMPFVWVHMNGMATNARSSIIISSIK